MDASTVARFVMVPIANLGMYFCAALSYTAYECAGSMLMRNINWIGGALSRKVLAVPPKEPTGFSALRAKLDIKKLFNLSRESLIIKEETPLPKNLSEKSMQALRDGQTAVNDAFNAGYQVVRGYFENIPSVSVEKTSRFFEKKTAEAQAALEGLSDYLKENPDMMAAVEKAKIGIMALSVLGFAYIIKRQLTTAPAIESGIVAEPIPVSASMLLDPQDEVFYDVAPIEATKTPESSIAIAVPIAEPVVGKALEKSTSKTQKSKRLAVGAKMSAMRKVANKAAKKATDRLTRKVLRVMSQA